VATPEEEDQRRAAQAGLEWPPGARYPLPPGPGAAPDFPGGGPHIREIPLSELSAPGEAFAEIRDMLERAPYCVSAPRVNLGIEGGFPVGTFVETPPLQLGRRSAAEGQTDGYVDRYLPVTDNYQIQYRKGGAKALPPTDLKAVGWSEDFGRWKVALCDFNGAKLADSHHMLTKVIGSRRLGSGTPREARRAQPLKPRGPSFSQFAKVTDDLLSALPDSAITDLIHDPRKRDLVVDALDLGNNMPEKRQSEYAALVDDLLGQLPKERLEAFLASSEKEIYIQATNQLLPGRS